jgi:hypothetical protein
MRWALVVVGMFLDLLGTVWVLQGMNILPGSFMTGDRFWAAAGVVTAVVGLTLTIVGLRRSTTPRVG